MTLRSETIALAIPFSLALIPIVGMVVASESVLLPEPISIARMVLVVGTVLTAAYLALRRAFAPTVAANALGLALLLIGLYPLVKTLIERVLTVPEFDVAAPYLVLCVISAFVAVRLGDRGQKELFAILAATATVFMSFSIALIGWAYGIRQPYSQATAKVLGELSAPLAVPVSVARKPDVFHLILDGMGRPDVLSQRYGMNLDGSIDGFRRLGFRIDLTRGYANYVQTHLSIPSMLNVTYLDDLGPLQGSTNDREPLRYLVRRARVPHVFKQLGYHVEFIGGGALSEGAFDEADVCDCPQLWFFDSEIGSLTLTPFKVLLGLGFGHEGYFRRALAVFQAFERPRSDLAPRYVYAHVMLPHPPFVVDERGNFRNPRRQLSGADASFYPGTPSEYEESYRRQATWVLQRTLEAVTRVLDDAHRQQREILVIISGDHGPRLGLDASHPTPESGRFTLPIWLAIRWPPGLAPSNPPKSLVNVYRSVFDATFGMDLPQLPDRAFVSGFTTPYDLVAAHPLGE